MAPRVKDGPTTYCRIQEFQTLSSWCEATCVSQSPHKQDHEGRENQTDFSVCGSVIKSHSFTDCYRCGKLYGHDNKSASRKGSLQFILIARLFFRFWIGTFIGIVHYFVWDKSRVESRAACLHFGLTRETASQPLFFFFLRVSHYDQCEMCLYFHWQRNNDWAKLKSWPPTLINSHRPSSMAPFFFHCENPASWCMNGGKKGRDAQVNLQSSWM